MTTPSAIAPLITDAGLAAAIAAQGNGLQLAIDHVQLGTAQYAINPATGSPDYARTALVAPKETSAIAGGYVLSTAFRVDLLLSGWGGTPNPYNVGEIGFFAGDPAAGGVLFAVWSQTPTAICQRGPLDYLATFQLTLVRVPFGSVTVSIDPDLAQAVALLAAHEAAANPHPQYLIPRHSRYYYGQP